MNGKTIHPAAAILPLMVGDEFAALVLDIKAHGLRDPIVLHPDGSILDGRNRYRACEKAGVEPHYTTWAGAAGTEVAYVISENLHRRHLDAAQRAMYFARFANVRQGGAKDKQGPGLVTQQEAAEMAGVDLASISRAKAVLKSDDKELIHAVEAGEVGLKSAAKDARMRKRQTPEQNRKYYLKQREKLGVRGKGEKQREQGRHTTAFLDAVDSLCSLPDPNDFIAFMKTHGAGAMKRRIDLLFAKQLPTAERWLSDFQQKWRTYEPARKQGHSDD